MQSNTTKNQQATKLEPLPKRLDGEHEEVELVFEKCDHKLKAISSIEVRCTKCLAGWTGIGVTKLLSI